MYLVTSAENHVSILITRFVFAREFRQHDVTDIMWKKAGQKVLLYTHLSRSVTTDEASESRFTVTVEGFLDGDLSLHISSVHQSDVGLYQCLRHDESQDGEPRADLLKIEGKCNPYW